MYMSRKVLSSQVPPCRNFVSCPHVVFGVFSSWCVASCFLVASARVLCRILLLNRLLYWRRAVSWLVVSPLLSRIYKGSGNRWLKHGVCRHVSAFEPVSPVRFHFASGSGFMRSRSIACSRQHMWNFNLY